MASKRLLYLFALLFVAVGLQSQDTNVVTRLPIKRIVLYKNGLGYFEHVGPVQGKQDVAISFTSGQLNDVLKSLTVLDLSGGRVTGVSYGSAAPTDRQLNDLRLPIGEKASLTEFLGALRGARIEVRSGTVTMTGRLLSVERKSRSNGSTTVEIDYISLITDAGEVRTSELSPNFSVRLLDKGLTGKVESYLDFAASGREADVRHMTISTEGTGSRSLFVSYISEVPIWKATYRIVLDSKPNQPPLLQGWAIVDNTVGQDWNNVELSLVAGAPQSFIQNLSQPYYSRRNVVPLPQSAMVTPQTYEATLRPGGAILSGNIADPTGGPLPGATVKVYDAAGSLAAQTTANAQGYYEFQSLPEGPTRLEVDAPGFSRSLINGLAISNAQPRQQNVRLNLGSAAQTVEVSSNAATVQTENASASSGGGQRLGTGRALGNDAQTGFAKKAAPYVPAGVGAGVGGGVGGGTYRVQAAAVAQELGDLFEYKLKEPVTIAKNSSSLVPILQCNVAAEKVSVWNESTRLSHPQRALWLTNTSGLTLDGGSFSVMEAGAFAGEGIFEPIRPDEKRLVSYATDLAVNGSSRNTSDPQRITRVRIVKGLMIQERELREKKTYTFRNEDSATRTVIVEHPERSGYELRGDVRPVESTGAWKRFRLEVPSKQTAVLVVEEARPVSSNISLTNINEDQIAVFVREKSVDREVETALRRILAQKNAVSELNSQKDALEEEAKTIFEDQQRLRENMKALKGSAEEKALLQRYTKQLNEQEDRLDALAKETKQLEAKETAAQTELNRMIVELTMDIKL